MLPAHTECSAQSRTCHGTQKSQRISIFGSQRKQTAVSDNLQHSAKTNYDIHNLISLDYKQDSKTSQYTHPFLKETLTIIPPFPDHHLTSLSTNQQLFNEADNLSFSSSKKFNNRKCWVLHLGWNTARHRPRQGDAWPESSSAERDVGVLVTAGAM